MGMSDEEILVNKGEFIALGLMWNTEKWRKT